MYGVNSSTVLHGTSNPLEPIPSFCPTIDASIAPIVVTGSVQLLQLDL